MSAPSLTASVFRDAVHSDYQLKSLQVGCFHHGIRSQVQLVAAVCLKREDLDGVGGGPDGERVGTQGSEACRVRDPGRGGRAIAFPVGPDISPSGSGRHQGGVPRHGLRVCRCAREKEHQRREQRGCEAAPEPRREVPRSKERTRTRRTAAGSVTCARRRRGLGGRHPGSGHCSIHLASDFIGPCTTAKGRGRASEVVRPVAKRNETAQLRAFASGPLANLSNAK